MVSPRIAADFSAMIGVKMESDRHGAVNESLVNLHAVTKAYRRGAHRVSVLDQVDLHVGRGEFIALMGPSGSGKSTLLNLIGGLDRPDAGQVLIDGSDIARYTDRQLTAWRAGYVGFVFQSYNLLPALSALQNVALPLLLTNLKRAEIDRRARTALEIVGLADRAAHRPKELSGGQEQRVAIARAIVSDPKLLICDEPTGGLDRETAEEVLQLLAIMSGEYGKTLIMVTHDPKAAAFARRVLHMDKGLLLETALQPAVTAL
jgi:putative ABC transport system ATP-binding protein